MFLSSIPVFLNSHLQNALAFTDTPDSLDRGDIAEIFEFGSGIFAALLCALSLSAYKKIKLEKNLICLNCLWFDCNRNNCITHRPYYS